MTEQQKATCGVTVISVTCDCGSDCENDRGSTMIESTDHVVRCSTCGAAYRIPHTIFNRTIFNATWRVASRTIRRKDLLSRAKTVQEWTLRSLKDERPTEPVLVYHVFTTEDTSDAWTQDLQQAVGWYHEDQEKGKPHPRLFVQIYASEQARTNDQMLKEDCLLGNALE